MTVWVLQLVAVATTVVAWVPQARAGLSSRSTEGVSMAAWAVAAALGATWSAYGALHQVWLLALSEGVFALGSVVVLVVLAGPRGRLAATVAGLAAAMAAGALALVLLPPVAFSAAGVAASFSVRAAQLGRMWRRRDASGVADSSWWLLTVALASWGLVGALRHQPALVAGSVVGVVSSVAVVGSSWWMRRPHGRPGGS